MTDSTLRRSFIALHLTLGIVILAESAMTLMHAMQAPAEHFHLAMLSSLEIVAALLFLLPRTMRFGGVTLVAVFAIAIVAHALQGEFVASLLVYAAATLFVTVHGSAQGPSTGHAIA